MTLEELAKGIDASIEVTEDLVDALTGVGFTEDQIVAISLAIMRVKKSN